MGCTLLAVFAASLSLLLAVLAASQFSMSPAMGTIDAVFFGSVFLYSLFILLLLLFGKGVAARRGAGGLILSLVLYILAGSLDDGRISGLEIWLIVVTFFIAWIQYGAVSCLAKRRTSSLCP
ncbi:hypothetical protein [Nitratifractor sp.]